MVHQILLERIRGEFLEMPGLQLTLEQAERLCGIERALCKAALDALVDARFLRVNAQGAYARLIEGDLPRLRPAPARVAPMGRHRRSG
jgi:hypothetical protein